MECRTVNVSLQPEALLEFFQGSGEGKGKRVICYLQGQTKPCNSNQLGN